MMATVLNKDPITYQKERDGFLRELQHFHETRGTPFRRVPQVNGHEIDLYLLYVLVTAHGGWLKVNGRNEWDDLMEQFKLPNNCVNSGVALKQVYLRYLDRYEKVHFLGDDGGRGSDDDDDSRHKRWSARALHSVPLTYNTYQHIISESQRAYHGLSTDLYRPSDYDRLAMSLMSPLPNEQDFAINVCTLLSNEGKHTLKLDKCPRLVDFLLAHAAVFNNEGTRDLFQEVYGKVRHSSMSHFWADVLEDPEMQHLADETQWPLRPRHAVGSSYHPGFSRTDCALRIDRERNNTKESDDSENVTVLDKNKSSEDLEYERIMKRRRDIERRNSENNRLLERTTKTDEPLERRKPKIDIEPSDLELFCLGRTMGTQDYLGQRVVQVATILRNLSFGEENQAILANNPTFLRFVMLCLGSRWDSLRQLGLDALGNIAPELQLERLSSDALLQLVLGAVTQRLFGQDRSGIIAALEVLNKLGQREDNEDALQRALDGSVYEQICRYLTLHDIMLLVHTLECLYSLSSLGERACNCIVRVHGAVDTLVSLITVEAQSYGPKACIFMRVVETVSGHESNTPSTMAMMQPVTTSQQSHSDYSQMTSLQPVGTAVQSIGSNTIKKVFQPMPNTPGKPIQPRPAFIPQQSGIATSVINQGPQYTVHQQHILPVHSQVHQHGMQPLQPAAQQVQGVVVSTAHVAAAQAAAQAVVQSAAQSVMQPVIHTVITPTQSQTVVVQRPCAAQSPQPLRQQSTPPPQANVQVSAQEMVVRENEQFAAAFLRATYENNSSCRVEQSEVYNKYLGACAKAGRKGVIAPHHFPKCVRTVFGVGTVPVVKPVMMPGETTPSGVSRQLFYEGIKVRPKPLSIQIEGTENPVVINQPPPQPQLEQKKRPIKTKKVATAVAGSTPVVSSTSVETVATTTATTANVNPCTPASPILLSQLSAPPKPKDTPTSLESPGQVITHPHLSQALLNCDINTTTTPTAAITTVAASTSNAVPTPSAAAQPSNTSLIKSLLATKVGEGGVANPPPVSMISGSLTGVTTANYNIDISNIQQVAQRQRLQQQQQQLQHTPQSVTTSSTSTVPTPIEATVQTTSQITLQATAQATAQTTIQATVQPTVLSSGQTPAQVMESQQPQQQSQPPTLLQQQLLQPANQQVDQQNPPVLTPTINSKGKPVRVARINGARTPTIIKIQGQVDGSEVENHISGTAVMQGRRDPPQPPPPPLAPLSSGPPRTQAGQDASDSTSVIKSTNSIIGVDDSVNVKIENTSLMGVLVNGAPHNSTPEMPELKMEVKMEIDSDSDKPVRKGNLMLEDLLEKSVDVKEPPILNGGLSTKDLCISDRGLELVARGQRNEMGKQIRITERGLEVVESSVGKENELVGMELRLTDRGLELVDKHGSTVQAVPAEQENVLQKELSVGERLLEMLEKSDGTIGDEVTVGLESEVSGALKREREEDSNEADEAKRPRFEVNGNGTNSWEDSSNQDEEKVKASSAAANLYSALAASVLEDEDSDILMQQPPQLQMEEQPQPQAPPQIKQEEVLQQVQEVPPTPVPPQLQLVQTGGTLRQVYVSSDPHQSAPTQHQQVMMSGPRQIIVSQAQLTGQSQVVITAGGQITLQGAPGTQGTATLKTAGGQTVPVLVQTAPNPVVGGQARPQGVILQQGGNPTQFIMSQPHGQQMQQMQLVQGQGGQLQLATSTVGGGTYVMAQSQTALIQGQPQTVLLTQTPQQQGSGTKTIIILQQQQQGPQPGQMQVATSTAGPQLQQKMLVTPQGQQVVVTQVPRPVIQTGAVSHTPPPALVATSQPSPAPSPSPAIMAPTGIPTPVLTANPGQVLTPIPTPTITANPNASTALRPNAIRPSPTPSPTPPTAIAPKPNGNANPAISSPSQTRMGTRSSVAKANMQNTTTTTTAGSGPASPAGCSPTSNTLAPKPTIATSSTPRRPIDQSMFLCEWRGCMRSFKSANEVYMHACEAHCPSGSQEIQCLWERCDAMKRKRFSLMTHLYDRHCNADVLRMMAMRRRQLSQSGRSEIPPPQPPPPHPGYAPNAAFHAIKRHALEFVNPKELLDDNEGPVTKSIRLTAALILRNLVIYSNSGRRLLRSYEPHLASVALSNVESSRTVAQVLYDMNDTTGNR